MKFHILAKDRRNVKKYLSIYGKKIVRNRLIFVFFLSSGAFFDYK